MTMMSKLRKTLRPVKQLLTSSRAQAPGTLYVPIEENWPVEPPNPPSREEAERFVKSYSFWYHCMYLGNGVYALPPTMADREWVPIKPTLPDAVVVEKDCYR